jgi:hypothetical protein
MMMALVGVGKAIETAVEVTTTITNASDASKEIIDFQGENNKFPDNATGQKMVEKHLDGYGKPLRYTLKDEDDFEIRSAGEDNIFETDDDLVVNYPDSVDLDD